MLEDSVDDEDLVLRQLRKSYVVNHIRVFSADAMREALKTREWDVILSDYSMPGFTAPDALRVLKEMNIDLPFIILSGTIGEEVAVDALKAGAHDFLVKDRTARLVPAIEREVREAATRRSHAEGQRALEVSEERFRILIDSMEDLVFTLDEEQRCDAVFGRWVEREHLDPATMIGKKLPELLGAGAMEAHDAAVKKAQTGERAVYEHSYESKGIKRYFQTALWKRRDRPGLAGVAREITELKRVEAQLAVSDRMASVGLLAAGVAHEINNPLTSVLGNLELAAMELNDDARPETLKELIDESLSTSIRIRDIVRDLKLFSRFDEERRTAVDVERVLDSCARMAGNEIRHRARLVKSYEQGALVEANESRLGQVFLNLLINAAQAIPAGKSDENEIRVSSRGDGQGSVIISISDTGVGMTPDVMKHLFMPFFTTKPVGVGTGLGLSICHRIVSSFNGTIKVESEIGKGTTFSVILPIAKASTSTLPAGKIREDSEPPKKRARILVVDDEVTITNIMKRVLGAEHDVTATNRGSEALALIDAGERFDVIFCDLMMPEMLGMDFYELLEKKDAEQAARIIFLTAGAFTPRAREFLATPNRRWVDKPFDLVALRALIHETLSARSSGRG
jgi:PAS domain S-box-containing protein